MSAKVVDREFVMARVAPQPGGCWHWTGTVNPSLGRGTHSGEYAYRIAYRLFVAPIPEGMQINHHCDNPLCVNPDHLYAGTQRENIRDAVARGRNVVPQARRGEEAHNAYPDQVIDDIRARYTAGEMQKDLAAEYGVSISCVRNWISGGARDRTPIKRDRPPCGTRSGYGAHIHRREPTCQPCKDANTTYLRAYKAKRYSAAATVRGVAA